ncbi:hypothetical protein HZC35_05010 [Candidatus Saganbacteria bacterium]|nr:hypothetical protein [Candidatus Saganbacteria bacterium]
MCYNLTNFMGKLEEDIGKFLNVYQILSPQDRAVFEAQLNGAVKNEDGATKKLYAELLSAAKDGVNIDDTILRMKNGLSPNEPEK